MAIKSIGTYEFPSRSRQELYGDDMLVHVWWADNPWFCSAVTLRVPRAATWGDLWPMIVEWAHTDPDFDENAAYRWAVLDKDVEPKADDTLADLGIRHKSYVAMRRAA